ncbi:FecR family protein [Sphingomonas sp. 179-A 2A2 NHS]|uniref:FecR family protein n=1 Tax=Sphingomonas sp. 179-A 2A2 NHS TaxID=3374290 RepID=UPI00387A1056
MSITDQQSDREDRALDSQAAHWFARMRGPDAEASRDAFDTWLAQGPEHRAAYNRAAEIFAMGKLLAEPDAQAPAAPRRRIAAAALTMVAAAALAVGGWALWHPAEMSQDLQKTVAASLVNARSIATVAGETRVVRLADGSTVRLGSDTMLAVDFGSARRDLKLLRGAARFEVAHEQRPFVVMAGGGSVTARGTIFEVALMRSGKVDVRLVQGAIDVALPRRTPSSQPAVRKLIAGESLSFDSAGNPEPLPAAAPGAAAPQSTTTARDFEATPVAELIALANRDAVRRIVLADPALGAQRVSGRFRIDDTGLLARRLAALFGWSVDMDGQQTIILSAGMADAAPSAAHPGSHSRKDGD